MAGKKRKKVREKDVEGIKYFDKLMPLLERLHDVGCERDSAGNRRLHMDQYCSLALLFLFNPICSSLRAIQQASELKKVQRKLGCPRASLGSLSESVGVFEPERLKEIIRELGEQLEPIAKDSRLKDVKRTITLVDGSLLKVLPWLSQRMLQKPTDEHKVRLHAHFEVDRHVPTSIKVTGGTARGKDHERTVMLQTIECNRLYVMDRGYAMFNLFNEIVAAGSSYVCRVRDNSSPEVIEQRPLCNEDVEAGVLDDMIVRFGKTSKKDARPDHPMRMVTIKTTPHVKRGKYKGGSTGPGGLSIYYDRDRATIRWGFVVRIQEYTDRRGGNDSDFVRSKNMEYWQKAPISREQIVLFAPTLDSAIPDDHEVRLLDEILRGRNWTVWEAEYDGRRGQPPIHPRIMAAVILYGLKRRVRSSRVLEYLLKNNVDFMWLAEGREIDHATICKFRTKFREQLKDLFRQIAELALAMGVARLVEVATDGTRVKANNGRFETLTAEGIAARLKDLDEQFATMLEKVEKADKEEEMLFDAGESSDKLPAELADVKARQKRLKDALEKVQAADKARRAEGINPEKNPAQVPTTDPDSRVLPNKEGGYAPNYTPMATTDVHGGFILDADVIAGAAEHTTTLPAMDRIKDNFGEYPESSLADGAHPTGQNIEGMEQRGIDYYSHIATPDTEGSNPALREDPTEAVAESDKAALPINPQTKKFDKSAFLYDEEKDVWHCPQGKTLSFEQNKSKLGAGGNRKYFKVYRCHECESCGWQADCRSPKAKQGRSVSRDEHAKVRERFAAKMAKSESKEQYKKRFHAAETPFGFIKQVMQLRQFLHRGLEKVKTEWLWSCTAYNLSKLLREVARLRANFSRLAAETGR